VSEAREAVLGRIRAALPVRPAVEIPRAYRREDDPAVDVIALLTDRLTDYKAQVLTTADVATSVAQALGDARGVVVPDGFPGDWLPAGRAWLRDDPPLTVEQLDGADAVLSTCAVAIAETGTLVLDTGPGMGRRVLSLVPDVLVVVVRPDQVVQGVPAAVRRLDPTRPLTFVSGPSATSDIELQRVEGVHGPRTLIVVLAP
jgi:L-lactate dehydrogenase complex protein LldG